MAKNKGFTITPTGTKPAADIVRLIQRAKRLKYSIAKSTTTKDTTARLQAELDGVQGAIDEVKTALDGT
ncbi:MAG: hypothetical protein JKY52_20035 [Flavobacteriales bacterium]|nr:hypothetical protein [Flavobacteriales bacterium]